MAGLQDVSVGVGVESTYGTGVTPTRWWEFTDESLDFRKNIKQGQGLRVGARVARSGRRVIPTADAGGDFTMECTSKGMGLLWQACLGTGAHTLVAGTTYQQLFTLGDAPSSLTVQKGLVQVGGTVDAYTYTGATVDSWELGFPNADIATLKTTIDCKDVTTATAYAAPTYATAPNLFHFANGSISSGTLTAPTTTALASGSTTLADIRGGTLKVDNNIKGDRYNFGASGRKAKPTTGTRGITGNLEVEYDNTTFRDAVLNDTAMSLILTFTAGALSTGLETLQVVVPEIKFDTELPKSNKGELITQPMAFAGLDNLTATQPIWVVTRTADTAL